MTKQGRLNVTEEVRAYAEKAWGPIEELGSDAAEDIVLNFISADITSAEFIDDDTIYYTYEEWDESDDYVRPAWTEEYLNTLGMSMNDFI